MKVGAASGAGAGGRAALAAASADGAGAAPKLKGAATGEAAAGTPKVKLLFAAPEVPMRKKRAQALERPPWGGDGPPGATGVLSGRGGRKRGSPVRSSNEVMHLIQGCHCVLLQKLCKMPKSQTLNP